MPVGDLGIQAVLIDPTGADVGAWEAKSFPGFTVLNEKGAPSWFELQTRDHAGAVGFYSSVFGWTTNVIGDSDEFRYTTMRNPEGEDEMAGIMDAVSFSLRDARSLVGRLGGGYVDAALTTIESLAVSVEMGARNTPYGRLAGAADPQVLGSTCAERTVSHRSRADGDRFPRGPEPRSGPRSGPSSGVGAHCRQSGHLPCKARWVPRSTPSGHEDRIRAGG